MITPRLNAAQPVVLDDGTMAQHFRQWALQAGLSIPVTGVGSPEGIIDAPQYSLYLDTTGSTGTIQYRKMLDNISGDTKQGWILL